MYSRVRAAASGAATCAVCGILLAATAAADTGKIEAELSGRLAVEGRWFPNEAAHPGPARRERRLYRETHALPPNTRTAAASR